MEMKPHTAVAYKEWLALGQNYELDKFAVTPVAFVAGFNAGFQAGFVAGGMQPADPLIAAQCEVGRAMIELTTTVRGQDEWPAIPGLWQCCMETRDAALRELDVTKRQLEELRESSKRDALLAVYWMNLSKMCGYYQDGTGETVKLHQDDATRTCIISIGRGTLTSKLRSYYGSSFEGALREAMEAGEADE